MKQEEKKMIKHDVIIKAQTDVWINQRTGEQIETTEILKPVSRQGFMITYLAEIINLIDNLGNKKLQVVKYILQNMDKSSNSMFCTIRELAAKTNTSSKTVLETLKTLEDNQIIHRRVGGLMVNPKLIHRGNNNKEQALLTRFYGFVDEETVDKEEV